MEIRRYLPSKRFAVFIVSIFLAGALVAGASAIAGGKPLSTTFSAISAITIGDSNVGDADSDGDGLRDWEEAVRGTDPDVSDTDLDGTSDAAEVAAYRDPLKAGPDDSLVDEASEKFLGELLAAASSTNLTSNLSQTIFARYVAARGEGSSGDIQTQQQVVDEAVTGAEVPFRGMDYQLSDLRIVDDTPANVRAFANGSMEAIRRYPGANFMLAMQTFGRGMDGDPSAIRELRKIGDSYHAAARDMARVPVPRSYAGNYLLAITAFDVAGGSFTDMAVLNDDPIRAVAGLQNYDRMVTGGSNVFVLLARQIARTGLVFSASEAGLDWDIFVAISNAS